MTEENIEQVSVDDLIVHPENPRQGDLGAIITSIKKNGWYGTVVAQRSTGHVLAGNHRLMAAQHLKLETVPVYWVDVDDATARRILLADNRTAELATYDNDQLVDLLTRHANANDLIGTGWDHDDVEDLIRQLEYDDKPLDDVLNPPDDATTFPRDVKSPVYTATGECPPVDDLYDRTRTDELISEINARDDLPDDIARFLRSAAERHTEFRFDRIAEFYCHADAETQDLFERSALVIIDFNRAVELGFVELREELKRLYTGEYGPGE